MEIFDGSWSTRYERIHGSVSIKEINTHKATNHEAQQHVSLERTRLHQRVHQSKDQLQAFAKLATRLFSEQDYRRTLRQPLQPPQCYGKGRREEFTPFCAVASSNGTLPTPSGSSKRYLHHFVTWNEKQRARRRHTQYERSHTGLDYGVLRIRQSRLGAAFCSFFPLLGLLVELWPRFKAENQNERLGFSGVVMRQPCSPSPREPLLQINRTQLFLTTRKQRRGD